MQTTCKERLETLTEMSRVCARVSVFLHTSNSKKASLTGNVPVG